MSEDFVIREMHGGVMLLIMKQSVSNLSDSRFLDELRSAAKIYTAENCHALLIDFNQIPFFGSSVLEGLCGFWDTVKHLDGTMALCNLSPVGLDIIRISRFDTVWKLYTTREEGLEDLGGT